MTFAGLSGGSTTSIKFFAKIFVFDASPAFTTVVMFVGLAEANTSAAPPWAICVASAELAPKLNFTVMPGWVASNCWPSVVNIPVSDTAPNTVTVPVIAWLEAAVAGNDGTLGADSVADAVAVAP